MTTAPTSDVLERLAERVETASGPDRELDAEIAFAAGHMARIPQSGMQLHYTASLDAAMTLVPDGHSADPLALSQERNDG